jgi:hypothetical protein
VAAAGFAEDKDANNDGVLDVVQIADQQAAIVKNASEAMDKQQTRAHDSAEKAKDRQLEREKLAAQERMNEANNRVALKNKVVGEK